MFLTALLALGVMPPPPPRREVDLSEVEDLMRDLQAVGIDTLAVADLTGPEDFVVKGRLILRAHLQAKTAGEIVTDVTRLLKLTMMPPDSTQVTVEPGIARRRAIAEVAQFADGSAFPAERGFDERVKSDRDRQQQRKAKKSRSRVKSRRGF